MKSKKIGSSFRIVFSSILVISVLALPDIFIPCVTAQGTEHPWPMFGQNPGLTGYTDSPAPRTPDLLWNYTTGDYIMAPPTVAYGKVFVGSMDNKTYALNQSTGEKIWEFTAYGGVTSSPAVADGRVFFGSFYSARPAADGWVYALDQSNGNLIWNYSTGPEWFSPVLVDNVVFAAKGSSIHALDASTGSKMWNSTIGTYPSASVAVAYGKVFAVGMNGYVYALNQYDGTIEWNYSVSTPIGDVPPAPPSVADNKVFVGGLQSEKIYALDQSTGNKIWEFKTGSWVWSSPAVAYGKVFITSLDNKTYALDQSSGTKLWEFDTGAAFHVSPAVADGTVFVASTKKEGFKIYALDQSTGSKIWEYTPAGGIVSGFAGSPGVVVADGKLIASFHNTVYTFGTHSLALTDMRVPSAFTVGESVTIELSAINEGDFTENFNLTLYHNNTKIETRPITGLIPGTSRVISFTWKTTGLQPGDYILKAAIENVTFDGPPTELSRSITANAPQGIPLGLLIAIIVIPIAVAAVLIIYLRRRKKKPKPPRLRLFAEPSEIPADGKSTSNITVELLDEKGIPSASKEDMQVSLSATDGKIKGSVTIPKGQSSVNVTLTSTRNIGTAAITATSKGLKKAKVAVAFMEKPRFCMRCGTRLAAKRPTCKKCGASPADFGGPETRTCHCGAVIPATANFCSECGAKQSPTER